MTTSPTILPIIILLLVAFAALVLGILIYFINVLAAERADRMVRKADEIVSMERERGRVFAGGMSEKPRLKPQYP